MVDSPVPYLMSDLLAALQSMMGKLDKPEKAAPFLKLKARIEELKSDPRYAFMFSGMLVSDSFVEVLNRFFRLRDDGKPIAIVDLSGVPSDIVKLVVGVLCRLAFDFAQWSMNVGRPPLVIVCEEAHRYVPALHLDENNVTRGILERIAKEGRKYGVCLGLVSQRPSDLSESVLSQCGTVLSMRMNNERDQNFVRAAMPEGARSSSTPSRPCATGNALSPERAWPCRCGWRSILWNPSGDRPRMTRSLPKPGASRRSSMVS
ncbi:ATP-binding protein [Hankyongella ginsenosidimutans]|uniref:ATP-binding protein n=1 Tax=Hankyongella ginsenosidimutans TaxID=1763828 RepID=UPI002482C0CF|nr:ATP-binding protein [Hankyongella ginsenosidimutans]